MTTSTEHPNAALMRDFFAAFGEADRERLARLMSPDLVWHFPGRARSRATGAGSTVCSTGYGPSR
jgi:ketosteroid isomerase-like protein